MNSPSVTQPLPVERIEKLILLLRTEKVLLDQQLAELYGVPTKVLIQAATHHRNRFPDDFMFQLSQEEFDLLKSRLAIPSWTGARQALPYAFTEPGVAMLSSVLCSERAVHVNVAIMRAFVGLHPRCRPQPRFEDQGGDVRAVAGRLRKVGRWEWLAEW